MKLGHQSDIPTRTIPKVHLRIPRMESSEQAEALVQEEAEVSVLAEEEAVVQEPRSTRPDPRSPHNPDLPDSQPCHHRRCLPRPNMRRTQAAEAEEAAEEAECNMAELAEEAAEAECHHKSASTESSRDTEPVHPAKHLARAD